MRRWKNVLEPTLDALNMAVIALSPDDPAAVKGTGERLEWPRAKMIADEHLEVTDTHGLRHIKALAPDPTRDLYRDLCVPSVFLVDAEGIIRWFDCSNKDHRVRAAAETILEQIEKHIGKPQSEQIANAG